MDVEIDGYTRRSLQSGLVCNGFYVMSVDIGNDNTKVEGTWKTYTLRIWHYISSHGDQ